jgi:multiple sugar transport system substrate-binding protein
MRSTARSTLALFVVALFAHAAVAQVTLDVIGFRVPPNEVGTPLDTAYQTFIAEFELDQGVAINALESPPDFNTYILTALATNTAPDVWAQDASSLAAIAETGQLLDMNVCQELIPAFDFDRFFPSVLALHQGFEPGKTYGVPNDFTPMVIYFNPESFERAGVEVPTEANLTFEAFLELTQRLTLDGAGRNALDPAFDRSDVEQYGFRVRRFPLDWMHWLWANGGAPLSPDGTTASGYLDSPASIEVLTLLRDMVTEYGVSPDPSALDALQASLGFLDLFLTGKVAMFPRGHWELIGLQANPNFTPGRVGVMGNPYGTEPATVIFESGFVIPASISEDKLPAACAFVEAATSAKYQDTKALTGIAISGNQAVAQAAIETARLPEVEQAFFDQVQYARPPYGALFADYGAVEVILQSMMEEILAGEDIDAAVADAVREINRELSR